MPSNSSMMMHCNLSCKYGECSFSCSGENLKIFENHLEECRFFPVECSNKFCGYTTQRKLMKFHSKECGFAIEKCPNGNCSLEMQRREMSSHLQTCPYQMVSCENTPFGCKSIMARKDLNEHLKTCPQTPTLCYRCGKREKPSSKHVCPYDTKRCPHCHKEFIIKNFKSHQNSCLIKCKLCEECFSNSEIRHHKCPIKKCDYRFCEYKDLPLNVGLHMNECGYRSVQCSLCQKNVLAKNLKLHASTCDKRVQCQRCHLYIERSSKDVHDMLDGFAKLRLTTCPTCREEVQSGLTNSQQDRNPQDEKHKTDEIFSAYNANNDQKQQELDIEMGHDVVHDTNDDKKYEAIAGMKLRSSCSKSRNWLRIFMEEIDKHTVLKQKVKDNEYHILDF